MGIFNNTKKKNQKVEEAVGVGPIVVEKLSTESDKTDAQLLSINRETGTDIKNKIEAAKTALYNSDFYIDPDLEETIKNESLSEDENEESEIKGSHPDDEDEESEKRIKEIDTEIKAAKDDLIEYMQAIIDFIDDAPPIADDISEIDGNIVYMADKLYEAISKERSLLVKRITTALGRGIIYTRDEITNKSEKEKELEDRKQFIKDYVDLIGEYEQIDIQDQAIKKYNDQIEKKRGPYNISFKQYQDYLKTDEGKRADAEAQLPDTPKPGSKAAKLMQWVDDLDSQREAIDLLYTLRDKCITEKSGANERAMKLEIAVIEGPNTFDSNEALIKYQHIWNRINDEVRQAIVQRNKLIELREQKMGELDSILNGVEANNIKLDYLKNRRELKYGDNDLDKERDIVEQIRKNEEEETRVLEEKQELSKTLNNHKVKNKRYNKV